MFSRREKQVAHRLHRGLRSVGLRNARRDASGHVQVQRRYLDGELDKEEHDGRRY